MPVHELCLICHLIMRVRSDSVRCCSLTPAGVAPCHLKPASRGGPYSPPKGAERYHHMQSMGGYDSGHADRIEAFVKFESGQNP